MKDFAGLRPKMYCYLKDKNNEDKKAKSTKSCVIKGKLKFQNYKNCFENKKNYLEKCKIEVDSLKEGQKEFAKNNKLILKTQQRFKSGITLSLKKLARLL